MNAAEAAREIGVTSMTIIRWIKAGRIKGERSTPAPHSNWYIPREEVDRIRREYGKPEEDDR